MIGSASDVETTSTSDTSSTTEVPTTEPGTSSTSEPETSDTSSGPAPFCGDGAVDEGEACDDGNQIDEDTCTSACQAAACGDGIVGPGEGCDDGDQDDADECTNACQAAGCGDGVVGPGEGCDDGNGINEDACTNACQAAACGDGVVQDGVEACDDANQVDGDACTSACQAAACGDGIVQDGVEACDDGDADDTDECLASCEAAACGDGIVQAGVEDCDDGDDVDADECSNACVLPTCSDGAKNGAETDVDCGGPTCGDCGVGEACGGDDDCGSQQCAQGTCASNKSCKALHAADPGLGDGMYALDPDEDGPNPPLQAMCDMSHDGGGWTLIMKSINSNYHYDDALWTNGNFDNPDDYDFVTSGKKSKYRAFTSVGFGELRTAYVDGSSSYIHALPAAVASAQALFTGPAAVVNTMMVLPYFNGMHAVYDQHLAGCNPSAKYVNFGVNLKASNGVGFLPDGGQCDWNGGARFGMRVNGNHGGTGNHAGQGWGTYTTVTLMNNDKYVAPMTQLLWVR
ncbi:MAG: DUF4215 domain-containing protein [Myxococcales bacterium]|nr:DUF4215 domain-containing protein [Myxococcales bacterium]